MTELLPPPPLEYLRPTTPEQRHARNAVEALIAELDRVARLAWPSARTPPATVIVAWCAWCAVPIESGDGREWRHTAPTPVSPAVHKPEPTRLNPPTKRGRPHERADNLTNMEGR